MLEIKIKELLQAIKLTNKSGWNLLWALTIVGILFIFFLYILRGSEGENDYGSPSTA